MPLEEPGWWYGAGGRGDFAARALSPIGDLYGAIVEARFKRQSPYRSRCPVICIGNFTAGGTGKTPLALFILEHLQSLGESPACLARGYGGRKSGPAWVDPAADRARDVGDEPLLVSRTAPVLVARDRAAGARMIENGAVPASVIVMDDGLQNPALAKDLVIAVVDGDRGVGNGRVIPAGPLRARLEFQLGLVDCVVVNAPLVARAVAGAGTILEQLKHTFPGPVLAAEAAPVGDVGWLADAQVIAFAGIGHPERFFRLLESLGARIEEKAAFPDHHVFTERDAERLLAAAERTGARLVTTEKDWARLERSRARCAELQARSRTLPIRLSFDERDQVRLVTLIEAAVKTGARRQG